MSREYSENVLVQNSAGNLLQNVLGWEVVLLTTPKSWGRTGRWAAPAMGKCC